MVAKQIKKIAIVPAYEPNEVLFLIVSGLIAGGATVVIVDDGSSEQAKKHFATITENFSNTNQVILLSHAQNQGKGAAVKTALRHIKKHYEESHIVTVDADGQHAVADALRVLETVGLGHEIVLGKRQFAGAVPLRSKIGNLLTIFLFTAFTGRKISDTQTGLRGFRSEFIDELISVGGDRYEWEFKTLLKFVRENYKIKEISIETIYEPGNPSSHFRKVADSIRIYKQFLYFSVAGISSVFVDYLIFTSLLIFNLTPATAIWLSKAAAAIFHYNILRHTVFKTTQRIKALASLRYFSIVALNVAFASFVLSQIESTILGTLIVRVFLDLILFMVSFYANKHVVFRR